MIPRPPQGDCKDCLLWQERKRPPANESVEVRHFRLCNTNFRHNFFGDDLDAPGGKAFTSPSGTCECFLPRGGKGQP